MVSKTERVTVTFTRPFRLKGIVTLQPAGDYVVVTDFEEILGLDRLAYRRVATLMQLPAVMASQPVREVITINPTDLADALLKDRGQTVEKADAQVRENQSEETRKPSVIRRN